MKKLLSISAAFFITSIAFAQDTIPPAKTSLLNSMKTDTVPSSDKWNKDTSALVRGNTKWADTSMKKTWPDSSLGSNNNTKWPDTTASSATMQHGKDSMTATTKQSDPNSKSDNMSATKTVVEDKVIMRDEKVYVVKNGDSTLLSDSLTLPSGAVVTNDATVRFKDGSTAKLKNGQYISIKPAPVEATAAKTDTSANTTAAAKVPVEDKVVMKDDQIIVIKNGDSTVLEDSIKLQSGAVVKKDGSVRFRNGSTTKLKNGQFIALNTAPVEAKKTKMKTVKKKEG